MENNIIMYKSRDGSIKVDVTLDGDTIWASLNAIAELFSTTKQNISLHLQNIYNDHELDKSSTVKEFLTVQKEGQRCIKRNIIHYNLDAVIATGYRVNSKKATDFRIWATKIIREYMIKGYSIDIEKLQNNGENPYFENLLATIRDIRASEKVFWRKILNIYATSIDYDANDERTIEFFKTIQNKMHFATHGKTASELIFSRVNSKKDNIGLTVFKGSIPTKKEVGITKNYLNGEELDILNRMTNAYLDVAEINALNHHPMKMNDWILELDNFLKLTRKDILKSKGGISHESALKKAYSEYNKYMKNKLSMVEKDYLEIIKESIDK